MLKKIATQNIFFLCRASSTAWATHKNSEKNQISCTGVHGFEEKSKFHVPGYMDLKVKQNIMYPGTWIWRKNKIPCTGVHESEKKKFLCVAQAVGEARHKKKYFFWQFFSTCEKINQFFEFCKYQGGKI